MLHAASLSIVLSTICIAAPLKLLPYPQELIVNEEFREIGLLQIDLSANRGLLRMARKSIQTYAQGNRTTAPTILRIGTIEDTSAQQWLAPADREFLTAHEKISEAYVLMTPATGPFTIVGRTDRGALYGAQTFIQLLLNDPGRSRVPTCVIRDWPDMAWRCLAPTLTWYSGYNCLEGYDLCNWAGKRERPVTPYGLSGVFILKLPARLVTVGKPCKLALRMKPGAGWVMVHGYPDPFLAIRPVVPPKPGMESIAAFTPHVGGRQGVTIGEFEVPLSRR